MTAPAPGPGRHVRPAVRPTWRRRADVLLTGTLVLLLAAGALTLTLVEVDVVGTGQAVIAEPVGQPGQGGQQRVLVLLSGRNADGIQVGDRVSVLWGTGTDPTDGTVDQVQPPAAGPDVAARYGLPVELTGSGDVVVAEAGFDAVPGARAGLAGSASAYLGHRPLGALFLGRGVEK